jgi:hypothetical protein
MVPLRNIARSSKEARFFTVPAAALILSTARQAGFGGAAKSPEVVRGRKPAPEKSAQVGYSEDDETTPV